MFACQEVSQSMHLLINWLMSLKLMPPIFTLTKLKLFLEAYNQSNHILKTFTLINQTLVFFFLLMFPAKKCVHTPISFL